MLIDEAQHNLRNALNEISTHSIKLKAAEGIVKYLNDFLAGLKPELPKLRSAKENILQSFRTVLSRLVKMGSDVVLCDGIGNSRRALCKMDPKMADPARRGLCMKVHVKVHV